MKTTLQVTSLAMNPIASYLPGAADGKTLARLPEAGNPAALARPSPSGALWQARYTCADSMTGTVTSRGEAVMLTDLLFIRRIALGLS